MVDSVCPFAPGHGQLHLLLPDLAPQGLGRREKYWNKDKKQIFVFVFKNPLPHFLLWSSS